MKSQLQKIQALFWRGKETGLSAQSLEIIYLIKA